MKKYIVTLSEEERERSYTENTFSKISHLSGLGLHFDEYIDYASEVKVKVNGQAVSRL